MIILRKASIDDIEMIADVFLRSRQIALPFLPIIYSRDQDCAHMADVLERGQVEVAIDDEKLVGFLVDLEGWVAHLYIDPDQRRAGIGKQLLDEAKLRNSSLELWCFQQNWAARHFYEKNGFECIKETDGDNEEKLPDRLYRWVKSF